MFPGIGIGGFRSFPAEPQLLGPLAQVNLVIGPNNTGKSNFLRIYHQHAERIRQAIVSGNKQVPDSFDPSVDQHKIEGESIPPLTVLWPVNLANEALEANPELLDILQRPTFLRGTETPWIEFATATPPPGPLELSASWEDVVTADVESEKWTRLSSALTSTSGGARHDDFRRVLGWVTQQCLAVLPQVSFVPAHRQIRVGQRSNGTPQWDLTGLGLIDQLDDLKNAGHTQTTEKLLYREICRAMAELLQVSSVEYNVSRSQAHQLELIIDRQHRPLSSFGTGYEHALLILVAVMTFADHLFCIEEPEVHLHPRLQRQLGILLRQRTAAQVIISTHSAHLIDALEAKIFRTTLTGEGTRVSRPLLQEQLMLLDDLGYRASDIMQTNCIIWVEGPSDRIYLNAWIGALEEGVDLVEGIHYTVMFYGGALLDRLTAAAEGDDGGSLVALRRIQQHFAIMADSDKREIADALKLRVQRVEAEVDGNPAAHLWVTQGREVENYVSPEALEKAVKSVHPTVERLRQRRGPTSAPLQAVKRDGSKLVVVDKVAVAEEVVSAGVDLDVLDLQQQVTDLVDFIRRANA